MNVALLTIHEKDLLVGQLYNIDSYFNPVQDCNNNWVITEFEINNNIYPEFDWIEQLPLIEWCAPPPEDM
jgi:hypothetical protein